MLGFIAVPLYAYSPPFSQSTDEAESTRTRHRGGANGYEGRAAAAGRLEWYIPEAGGSHSCNHNLM